MTRANAQLQARGTVDSVNAAIELAPTDLVMRWNALLDRHPWLDGLESSCGNVACCPANVDGLDWSALSQACGLLFLATGNSGPERITRDLLVAGA